jgi:lysophospholipase L1-like esterase
VSSTGAQVVLITPPCSRVVNDGIDRPDRDPARVGHISELQRQAVARFVPGPAGGGASIVDLNVAACGEGYVDSFEGVDWRPDGVHFSPDGAAVASQWVIDQLSPAAKTALRLG